MSIKERKAFESTERTFSKGDLKKAEEYLIAIVGTHEEDLKDEKKVKEYKLGIMNAARLLCCEAVGLKPSAIDFEYVEEGRDGADSNTLMSFGRYNRIAEKMGSYGVIRIYPMMQNTNNLIYFLHSYLHEFVHISQMRLRESGKLVPKNISTYAEDASLFDIFKFYIDYSASFCELDANITASKIILKWLKRDDVREKLPKNELKKRRAFLKKLSALSLLNCTIGNCSRAMLYTLCSPYFLYKAIKESGYRTTVTRDFDKIDEDISWNTKRKKRSVIVADKFIGKTLARKEITADKRRKLVDLLVVQHASSLGIDPSRIGVLYSLPDVHTSDVRFINSYDYEKKPKTMGYIEFDRSVLAIDSPELICGLVEVALDSIDNNPDFIKALKKEKERMNASNDSSGERD